MPFSEKILSSKYVTSALKKLTSTQNVHILPENCPVQDNDISRFVCVGGGGATDAHLSLGPSGKSWIRHYMTWDDGNINIKLWLKQWQQTFTHSKVTIYCGVVCIWNNSCLGILVCSQPSPMVWRSIWNCASGWLSGSSVMLGLGLMSRGWLSVKLKETANRFKNPIKLTFFTIFVHFPCISDSFGIIL